MANKSSYAELENRVRELEKQIASRKEIDENLKQSEERLIRFQEASPDGFFLFDAELNVLDVNQTGLDNFGLVRDEMIGKNILEIKQDVLETGRYDQYLEVLKTGKPLFLDDVIVHTSSGDAHLAMRAFKVGEDLGIITTDITQQVMAQEAMQKAFDQLDEKIKERTAELVRANHLLKREIRERKQAENKFKESEAMLRSVLENSPDFIYIVSPEGKFLFISRTVSGLTEGDVLGKNILDYIEPDYHEIVLEKLQNVFQRSQVDSFESQFENPDGSLKSYETRFAPIKKDSDVVNIIGIVRDITDIKRAEAERLSHLRFLENMELVDRAVHEADDVEQMIQGVIETVFSIFGCDRAWLMHPCDPDAQFFRIPIEVTRPEYPGIFELYKEMPMTSDMSRYCREALATDGLVTYGPDSKKSVFGDMAKRFSIMSQIMTALYPNVGSPWLFGMHQCSFPRVWTEEEQSLFKEIGRRIADGLNSLMYLRNLRESEERYRLLFESTHNPTMLFDRDGRYLLMNGAAAANLGGRQEDFIGKSFHDLFPNHAEELMEKHRRVFDSGVGMEFEFSEEFPVGKRWFWCHLNPVKSESGEIFAIQTIAYDITEHKIAEQEKERLQKQLQQSHKMEAIGKLAGGIAHDFNNLLMGIQGRTSLMLLNIEASHPHFEHLKGIEEYVKRASDLTGQLLGFARGGKYEIKPTNINDLIRKTADMFGRTRKEIHIYYKFQEDIRTVEVDRGQMEQVLLNLFVNAWQSMPAGGDLYLETKNVVLDKTYVEPHQVESGEYVNVSVTDTGVGMDEATQRKIFDPFFTTKEMGRGTGLGLASAYGIIKNHGGIINVYSEKGLGTTLKMYLPASEKNITEIKDSSQMILSGNETILLVDDEAMILEVGGALLEELGFKVLQAGSGQEAIDIYAKHKDQIDMVILDMIMPDMGGGNTYDQLKEINANIKVLLSSGYSINGQATDIMNRGCNGFVQKPFNLTELSHKIRELLDDG